MSPMATRLRHPLITSKFGSDWWKEVEEEEEQENRKKSIQAGPLCIINMCVCVLARMCIREKKNEREKERGGIEKEKERMREREE